MRNRAMLGTVLLAAVCCQACTPTDSPIKPGLGQAAFRVINAKTGDAFSTGVSIEVSPDSDERVRVLFANPDEGLDALHLVSVLACDPVTVTIQVDGFEAATVSVVPTSAAVVAAPFSATVVPLTPLGG